MERCSNQLVAICRILHFSLATHVDVHLVLEAHCRQGRFQPGTLTLLSFDSDVGVPGPCSRATTRTL